MVASGSAEVSARVASSKSIGVLHFVQMRVPSELGVRQMGQTIDSTRVPRLVWVDPYHCTDFNRLKASILQVVVRRTFVSKLC